MGNYYPLPIACFLLACLAILVFSKRVAALRTLTMASFCGVYLISFTGGTTGAIWLVEAFLVLFGVAFLSRRQRPALASRLSTRLLYGLFTIYGIEILVGFIRYDASIATIKSGSYGVIGGIPLPVLMAAYRLFVLTCLYFAFTVPLKCSITRDDLTRCLATCWFGAIILAVAGLVDYFGIANMAFTRSREVGYEHDSMLGFYRGTHGLMLYSGLVMSFALTQSTRSIASKSIVFASMPLLILALLLTWSRSSVVALTVACIVLTVTLGGTRALKGLTLGLLGFTIIFAALAQLPDIQKRYTDWFSASLAEGSGGRVENWIYILNWLASHPDALVFGMGFQNFNYTVHAISGATELTGAHNSYLHILTECGITGLVMLCAWIAATAHWAISWRRTAQDSTTRTLACTFAAYLLGLSVAGITEESLLPSRTFVPICLFMLMFTGIFISYYRTTASMGIQAAFYVDSSRHNDSVVAAPMPGTLQT